MTLAEMRAILEKCDCQWSVLAREWDGTLFAVERSVEGQPEPLVAVFHMFDASDSARVPYDTLRAVCENLDIPPDIFAIQH